MKRILGQSLIMQGPALSRLTLLVATLMSVIPASASSTPAAEDACTVHKTPSSLPSGSLKVLSLNVAHGRNKALNQLFVTKDHTYRNLDKIVALFEKIAPDVVALQEADGPSRWSGRFDHVAYIAQEADFPCLVHGRHSQSWLSSYGTALLSRSRPADSTSVQFPPSWPSKQKGYVSATFDWPVAAGGVPVTIVSVHLDFLSSGERDRQISEMSKGLSEIEGALVVMGDFNSQWQGHTSQVRMLADKLNLQVFHPEASGLGTYKDSTGKRLDWILITQELEFVDYRILPDVVADHFAVYAEIEFRGQQ